MMAGHFGEYFVVFNDGTGDVYHRGPNEAAAGEQVRNGRGEDESAAGERHFLVCQQRTEARHAEGVPVVGEFLFDDVVAFVGIENFFQALIVQPGYAGVGFEDEAPRHDVPARPGTFFGVEGIAARELHDGRGGARHDDHIVYRRPRALDGQLGVSAAGNHDRRRRDVQFVRHFLFHFAQNARGSP